MTFYRRIKGRNDEGISLNNMIIFSFLLHALSLSIIFLSPSMPSPRWTFGPVYSVNLVSLPADFIEKRTVSSISEEVVGIDSSDNSVVLRKEVKRISPLPIKRITARKKSAMQGRSIRKVGRPVEDVKGKVSSSSKAFGPRAPSATAEMSMNMRAYYSTIWFRIKGKWTLPQGILPDDNIEVVIGTTILRDGAITDLGFERRSGNKYFDESAIRAIKKASPFPPLPEWIKGSSIDVGMRFHSSEL